jgi:hypothetical protein
MVDHFQIPAISCTTDTYYLAFLNSEIDATTIAFLARNIHVIIAVKFSSTRALQGLRKLSRRTSGGGHAIITRRFPHC